jgi:hypothetical protein
MVEPYEIPCPTLPRFAKRTCPFFSQCAENRVLGRLAMDGVVPRRLIEAFLFVMHDSI